MTAHTGIDKTLATVKDRVLLDRHEQGREAIRAQLPTLQLEQALPVA